jgi:phosphohistidine phosphatase SixA
MTAVCIALLVAACGPNPSSSSAAAPSAPCTRGHAVILLRHAEKASAEKDTPLSERGRARAQTLASMLASAGVTRLVATQYRRTQETLAPLAESLSLPIDVRPSDKPAELATELRAAPDGSLTVVASHSDVVPGLVRSLAGAKLHGVEGDMLADNDFSRVIVVTSACGAAPFVVELSSGD